MTESRRLSPVAARVLPSLPDRDPLLGEIRWDRWNPGVVSLCARVPTAGCGTCAYDGAMSTAFGATWHTSPARRQITNPSRIADGQRPASRLVPESSWWVRTHYAVRCPACDETFVHRMRGGDPGGEFTELTAFYQPPAMAKRKPRGRATVLPRQNDTLF